MAIQQTPTANSGKTLKTIGLVLLAIPVVLFVLMYTTGSSGVLSSEANTLLIVSLVLGTLPCLIAGTVLTVVGNKKIAGSTGAAPTPLHKSPLAITLGIMGTLLLLAIIFVVVNLASINK